jgi:AraC-like DNA-binding protein
VRSTLKGTIGAAKGTKSQITALLDLHPRTLQRRLTAEGATFEDIRDEVCRAATWRLLHDTAIPFGQAAAALGFSEQSAMLGRCDGGSASRRPNCADPGDVDVVLARAEPTPRTSCS